MKSCQSTASTSTKEPAFTTVEPPYTFGYPLESTPSPPTIASTPPEKHPRHVAQQVVMVMADDPADDEYHKFSYDIIPSTFPQCRPNILQGPMHSTNGKIPTAELCLPGSRLTHTTRTPRPSQNRSESKKSKKKISTPQCPITDPIANEKIAKWLHCQESIFSPSK